MQFIEIRISDVGKEYIVIELDILDEKIIFEKDIT